MKQAQDVVGEQPNAGNNVVFSSVDYVLPDNVQQLVLTGDAALTATGNAQGGTLVANNGDSMLIAGSGITTMIGGVGDNTFVVNNEQDVVVKQANDGNNTILASVNYVLPQHVQNLTLTGGDDLTAIGNDLNGTLTGNGGHSTLIAGSGNETLVAGTGITTMIGGIGDNTYIVNNELDAIIEQSHQGIDSVFASADYILSANVENLTLIGTGDLTATGNDLNNIITANSGNDTLNGGGGKDTLIGGTGHTNYILAPNGGIDTILATAEGFNTVELTAGLQLSDLTAANAGNDLLLRIAGSSDGFLIRNYGAGDQSWNVATADGQTIALPTLLNQIAASVANENQHVDNYQAAFLAALNQQLQDTETPSYVDYLGDVHQNNSIVDTVTTISDDADIYGQTQNAYEENEQDLGEQTTTTSELITAYEPVYEFMSLSQLAKADSTTKHISTGGNSSMTISIPKASIPIGAIPVYSASPNSSASQVLIGYNVPNGTQAHSIVETSSETIHHRSYSSTDTTMLEIMQGGASNNTIHIGDGHKLVDAGAGDDLITTDDSTFGSLVEENFNFIVAGHAEQLNNFLYGGDGNDAIIAGGGNDRPYGWRNSDVLIGGRGDDYLNGGSGSDRYVVFTDTQQGWDAIFDSGDYHDGGSTDLFLAYGGKLPSDTVQFDGDVHPSDLHFGWNQVAAAGGRWALTISWGNDAGIRVVVPRAGDPQGVGIEQFQFANGTTLSMADMLTMAPPQPVSDVFTFEAGMGPQVLDGDFHQIHFAAGATPADVTVSHDSLDLVLSYNNGTDVLSIPNWYADPAVTPTLSVTFADGTTWNPAALTAQGLTVQDTAGNQTLIGLAGYGNTLIGGPNDTLIGGGGNDTFVYNTGSGANHIIDSGNNNTLQFGSGITPDMISLGLGSLLLRVGPGEDAVHIEGFDPNNPFASGVIQNFRFADGTTLTYEQLLAKGFDLKGTAGDDTLTGTSLNNRLNGGAGNDSLIGGSGSNTFIFNMGDGNDTVVDNSKTTAQASANDVIQFGAGIARNDVHLTQDGADLVIRYGMQGDSIIVHNFMPDGESGGPVINHFAFADGNVYSYASLIDTPSSNANHAPVVTGYDQAIALNQTINAANLFTVSDADQDAMMQYQFRTDTTGGGYFAQYGNATAAGETITINAGDLHGLDYVAGGLGHQTLEMRAFDGKDWGNWTNWNMLAYTSEQHGINWSETLLGGDGADLLDGNGGNDWLFAGGGDDVFLVKPDETGAPWYKGGDGFDTILGSVGDDTIMLNEFGAANGVERIDGGAGHNVIAGFLNGNNNINLTGIEVRNIAEIQGGSWSDWIIGTAGDDVIVGKGGNDLLKGGAGDDVFLVNPNEGGAADYIGGDGFDRILGSDGDDTIGINQFSATNSIEQIDGGSGYNTIAGFWLGNNDIDLSNTDVRNVAEIQGGAWSDRIIGSVGDDVIRGNDGNDVFNGSGGNDILEGGGQDDTMTQATGNYAFLAGAGNDVLNGGSGNGIVIGGLGDDIITLGAGHQVVAFNKGDGQDTLNVAAGQGNALSLGGDCTYADLSFQKSGNDLVLNVSNADHIDFKNWYADAANQSMVTLQAIAEAMADFAPGSNDVLRNDKIENFDFQQLVHAFDQARAADATLDRWSLTNALLDAHLTGSDTQAMGGDLAYQYGVRGNLTGFSVAAAQSTITDSQFAAAPQTLQAWPTLNTGTAQLK